MLTGAISLREAYALVSELAKDPSSHLYASMAEWEHPISREALILADIHDRYTTVNYKMPKPYPRPSDKNVGRSKRTTRRGRLAMQEKMRELGWEELAKQTNEAS